MEPSSVTSPGRPISHQCSSQYPAVQHINPNVSNPNAQPDTVREGGCDCCECKLTALINDDCCECKLTAPWGECVCTQTVPSESHSEPQSQLNTDRLTAQRYCQEQQRQASVAAQYRLRQHKIAALSRANGVQPQPSQPQLWNPTAVSLCSLLHREDIQGRWIEIVLARAKYRSVRQRKHKRERERRERHVVKSVLAALPTEKDIMDGRVQSLNEMVASLTRYSGERQYKFKQTVTRNKKQTVCGKPTHTPLKQPGRTCFDFHPMGSNSTPAILYFLT